MASAILAAALVLPLNAGANPAAGPGAFSQTTTGNVTAGVIPDGTCRARVTALGGAGGSSAAPSTGGLGGAPAQIVSTFSVLPLQGYSGSVGGGGAIDRTGGVGGGGTGALAPSGHSGAGGGGRTVATIAGQDVVIAGGGGGGGGAHQVSPAGSGGAAGAAVAAGTAGPGATGINGADSPAATVSGGQGGQAAAGGAGGVHSGVAARNGLPGAGIGVGTGGAGGLDLNWDAAGGGGAGYTGGGGGASTVSQNVTGAGGGGGSSWVAGTSPVAAATVPSAVAGTVGAGTAAATAGANGSLAIDWLPCLYDLATTKTVTPSPVSAGQTATWTITVTNNGPDPMTRGDTLDLADTLPGPATSVVSMSTSGGTNTNLTRGAVVCTGVTPGSPMPTTTNCSRPYSAVAGTPGAPTGGSRGLDPGETLTIVYTQPFAASAAAATITNTATVQDRPTQTGTTNVIGTVVTDNTPRALTINQRADLRITKTASANPTPRGSPVTYTLTIENLGPSDAAGVVATDSLPAGVTFNSASAGCANAAGTVTCTIGALAAGATAARTITITPPTAGTITNNASVSTTTTDPVAANNTTSFVSTVQSLVNLGVTKTVSNAAPNVGANVTFTIGLTNAGPDTAQAVVVSDLLPAGFTFVSATPTVGTYVPGTGIWTVGNMTVGATPSMTIVATVTSPNLVTNTATVSSNSFDTNTGNNTAGVGVDALDADVALTKVVSNAAPNVGDNVTFTLTATNNGPSSAQAVTVSDVLPAGLTFVSASPGGVYNSGTGVWTVGNLANGANSVLQIVATVTSPAVITNTATVTSTTFDTVSGNNTANVVVDAPSANLGVTKIVSNATPALGSNVTFTIGLTNSGPDAAQSVNVADLLPAGLTFVSATPSVGTYTPGTGVWAVGTVASGATPSLQIVATVTNHTAITNTATVTSPTHDAVPGNNTANVVVDVPDANLAVTKTVSNATPALNSNVTFTVTVTNTGPDAAQSVNVADLLPAGLTFVSATTATGTYASGTGVWALGTVANGAAPTIDIVATVTQHTAITNVATATTTTFDPNTANNADDAIVNVPDADLVVTKNVSNTTPAFGTVVTFTVGVTNNGPDTAQAVTVNDLLPPGLTFVSATASVGTYDSGTGVWTVGAIANGVARTLQVVATVNTHTLATNSATATSTTHDPDTANNAANAAVNVPDANLSLTKTVDNAAPALNANVTFTINLANSGPDAAQSVNVNDLLPVGLTFVSATASTGTFTSGTGVWAVGTVASGDTPSLQIVATVTTHTAITNIATATSTTYDPTTADNTDAAVVDVPNANLVVTKTVSNATPALNANVTFRVTVSNIGPDAAESVSLTDVLPAGLTFISAAPSTGSFASGTGVWTIGTLANGAAPFIDIVATVTQHTALTNSATATSTTFDPDTADNTANVGVNVPDANLAVTKTVNDATPEVGQNVTFTVTVTNNGPDTSQGLAVNDLLPAGLTFVSATPSVGSYVSGTGVWTVGNLADGASANITIVASVTATGTITNVATATATTHDPSTGDNTANAPLNAKVADLQVTKTVSNATPTLGSDVTFTLTVTNNGPSAATGVAVNDALPAGLTFVSASPGPAYNSGTGVWTIGGLANGASSVLTITATVTNHTAITNTATVTSTTFDNNATNNSAQAIVNVPDANLAVTKTVTDATPAVGSNVTFTVTVTNTGPDTAQAVTVADLLPAGLTFVSATPSVGTYAAGTGTWTVGAIANAAAPTLQIVATVTTHTAITNTATATNTTHDPTPGNNTDNAVVDAPNADLAVTKTVNDAAPEVGANVTFTIALANDGVDTAQAVQVSDLLPSGLTFVSANPSVGSYTAGTGIWTVGAVAVGATPSLQIVATVTTPAALTNTAAVTSSTFDPVSGNNSSGIGVDARDADVQITKTVDNATPALHSNVIFTLTAQNNGPSTAQNVVVADVLPAGLTFVSASPGPAYNSGTGVWTVGNLTSGASSMLTITATVTQHTAITNAATVTATTHDPVSGNNTDDVVVDVPDANLAITKSVDTATPALNSNVTFTITLANTGPDAAQSVNVNDALPAGLTFVSATPSVGTYAAGTGVWSVGTVNVGATPSLQIVATVTNDTAITNTATVTSTTHDPTPGNNTDDAVVDVPDANLVLNKTVSNATPALGSNVTFTLNLMNVGTDTAQSVVVNDLLPAGLTFVSATPSVGTYTAGTGVWSLGDVAVGATPSLDIVATVTQHTAITNTATATSSTHDPVPGNNSGQAVVNVPDADLAVTKSVNTATPALGSNVTFTIGLNNAGPDNAQGVLVSDLLPSGLTFVSATPTVGTYASGTGIWTVGSVASGATPSLQIVATVTAITQITNTAAVSSTTHDTNALNNSASADVDVPNADLAITKSVDNATPALGTNVTFTIDLTNNGVDSAQAVTVNDLLPAGLTFVSATPSVGTYTSGTGVWSVGTVNVGATPSLQIVATVTNHTAITNTATVTSTTHDPSSANNTDDAVVDVPNANVGVTKTVDNAAPNLGQNVVFTLTATNIGPDVAQGVSVVDALPTGLTLVSATPSAGSYSGGVWSLGALASGANETLTITATVTQHTLITNTATITATTHDPTPGNNTDSAVVNVPDADLALTKSVSDATPSLGSNVTFTIALANSGANTAQGVTVNDSLPAGLTFVSATPSVGTYSSGTGVWTVGNAAVGATPSLTIVATVTQYTAITNVATVTATTHDPASANNTEDAVVNVRDTDLAVTKVVDNPAPLLGSNVTFTVTAANNGVDNATGVTVNDLLPAGLTFVSATPSAGTYTAGTGVWAIGNFANGATATLDITATVTSASAIRNDATISGNQHDPVAANNAAFATLGAQQADLVIAKSVDVAAPSLGSNVTFTVVVQNNGPDATTGVYVDDLLPAGLTLVSDSPSTGTYNTGTGRWTIGALANGGTASLDLVATITQHTAITNTATVASDLYDPTPGNNTDNAVVDVPNADLSVTKNVSNATPAVGANVTFTVQVANAGPNAAQSVVVTDVLPAGLTYISSSPSTGTYNSGSGAWAVGALANAASASIDITATVTAHTLITNTATVTSSTHDPVSGNNADTADVNAPDANLAITKTVSDATPTLGSNVNFTIQVSNGGPDTAENVVVNDLLPVGLTFVSATPSVGTYVAGTGVWTIGPLANAASVTLNVTATVTQHTAITNIATVTSATFDPTTGNNTDDAVVNVPDADLAVAKSVDNAATPVGSNATFTIAVTNVGPDTAQAVTVNDLLPAGLTFVSATPSVGTYTAGTGVWSVGNVAVGATPMLTIVATVTSPAAITNTATVSATTHDPNGSNNSDDAAIDAPEADIAVTKSVDNATPGLNSNVTFTVQVTNAGVNTAQGVVVNDLLPAGLALVSATPSTGSYTPATGVWTIGAVTVGATPTLTIVATVTTHTAITNTATVTTTTHDPNLANNTDDAVVDVPDANLAVTKTSSSATPTVGSNVTFTVAVGNSGPDAAQSVTVTDLLPAGLTFVSATPTVGTYTAGTGVWTLGTVANGASEQIAIVATVTGHTATTNTATISSPTHDPTPGNNTSNTVVNAPDADVVVVKNVNNPTPDVGDNVTFTVDVTNNGADPAQNVVVNDLLPTGLTLVSATPTVGSYVAGTGVWTIGSLANGATATLTVVATVTQTGAITNTATATSSTFDPTIGNNADDATVGALATDVSVTNTVDNPTPALNSNVTFTVTVTNNGGNDATGVRVSDLLPAGLTFVSATPTVGSYVAGTGVWTIGNLANGASQTLTIVATVTSAAPLNTTATVSSTTFDTNPANNSAPAGVDVPEADVQVTKTVDNSTPNVGGNVTFTLTARNNGPQAAANVVVSDTLPAGLTYVSDNGAGAYNSGTGVWTVGSLANGATETLTIIATATQHLARTNSASITTTTLDPNNTNNSDSVAVNALDADVAVTKGVSNATPTVGSNVTFTIDVTNNGPNTSQGVTVNDLLPTGLTFVSATPSTGTYTGGTGVWTVGALTNGATESLAIVATVTTHTAITNTAAVTSTTFDPNSSNDADDAAVDAPEADLAITKTVDDPTPNVGQNVVFTLTVQNNGSDSATGVVASDVLPAGLIFVSASSGAYSSGTGDWTIGTLTSGASSVLTITATVTSASAITNTATVTGAVHDPNTANNTASAPLGARTADIAVTKTVSDSRPNRGANVTFTVTVTNNGPDTAVATTVTDALPAGLAFVSATPSVGTYASGTGLWTVGDLANGASANLAIVATVTDHALVTNTATGATTTFDSNATNDADSAGVNALDADLAVTKSVDNATPNVGDNVTFTIALTNTGPDDAQAVTVNDPLPTGLTFVSATPSRGTYTAGTGVWSVGPLVNASGATLTIVATVATPNAVTNTATVTSTTFDPASANNTDDAGVNALNADVAVTNTVNNATPNVGDNVTFTVTVTNNGPDGAAGVSVADLLPPGFTFVSSNPTTGTYNDATGEWTIGALANGQTQTLEIVATVTTAAPLNTTATVSTTTFDTNATNDTADAGVDAPAADLAISKSVDNTAANVGQNVVFTLQVTNNGPDAAQAITVNDTLPAGLTYVSDNGAGTYDNGTGVWTVGNLANGATRSLQITATVSSAAAITNVATVDSPTFDPSAANNTDAASLDAPNTDPTVAIAVSDATPALNSPVTYTITVTNNGPDGATGVNVTDLLPTGLTYISDNAGGAYNSTTGVWTVGNLASGASQVIEVVARVTDTAPVTNTATVASTSFDTNLSNNTANVVVDVPEADLVITKTVDDATPDLNGVVRFTVSVTNNGPNTAAGVVVSDALPAGLTLVSSNPSVGTYSGGFWTVGNLASGATETLAIDARVTTASAVTNVAIGASSTFEANPGDESADAQVDVPNADVAVTKTVDNAAPRLGDNVTFRVTVTNNGTDVARGIIVTDALPTGLTFVAAAPSAGAFVAPLWSVGNLATGASQTLDIVARVDSPALITNTATVTSTTFDGVATNDSAQAQVDVAEADLRVEKTVSDASPSLGTNVTFTVRVTNDGPNTATAVSVNDAIPAGLTLVSATASVGTYSGGVWSFPSLATGATETLTIVTRVDTLSGVTNTATAGAAEHDVNLTNNTGQASVAGVMADLVVTKTVNDATPPAGGNVTFTVGIRNDGPDTANGVEIADALPAGLTLVSATPSVGTYAAGNWTIGSLANGATANLAIVATVTTNAPVTNTATATSTTFDPDTLNNVATAGVNVLDADLQITKTVDNATPDVNDTVTFTITARNNGADTAAAVSITDALPIGLTFVSANPSVGTYNDTTGVWTVGALANSATQTLQIVARVATGDAVVNTATGTSSTFDPNAANNEDTASVDAPSADLVVTKTASTTSPNLGGNVTFQVSVRNDGGQNATGVGVQDLLPNGLTYVSHTTATGTYADATGVWNIGNLANGATVTLDVVAQVTSTSPITNIATVTATTFDANIANNSDRVTVDVAEADLAITKTVNDATPAMNGLVTFTVTLTNNGPDAATNVVVADPLPGGLTYQSDTASTGTYSGGNWTLASLAPGVSANLQIVARVTTDAPVVNIATASSDTNDPVGTNNSAQAVVDVPNADLAVTKTVNDATPAAGGNVTYNVTVTNNGPNAALAVSVADTLPAGLTLVSSSATRGSYSAGVWTVGTLANGANAELTIVATVGNGSVITNTAVATTDSFDPNTTDNTASVDIDAPNADLAVTKTVDDATPSLNGTVTYTVTVTNNGPDTAPASRVVDALPTGLTLLSSNATVGTYAAGVWTVGALANGASEQLTISARVTDAALITNTATASSNAYDGTPANNTDSVDVDVPEADLAVTKTVDDATPALGTDVTFQITVTNNGPRPAVAVRVADALPAGLTFVSSTPSLGTYNDATGIWTVGAMANGVSETLDIVATVTSVNRITNTATASASSLDGTPGNDTDSASVDVPEADVTVTKTVNDATPALNGRVIFTITATNNGPNGAAGVVVTDTLPAGLTFVSSNSAAYDGTTWTVGALASGASEVLTITADVTSVTAITNTATITTTTRDPDFTNNADNAVVNVPEADLRLQKLVSDPTPRQGANVTYTLRLTNNGPDTATGVSVTDALPAEVTYVSAAPPAGTSFAAGVWTISSIASGVTRDLPIVVRIDAAGLITNDAEVTASGTFDPTSTPNDAMGDDAASVDLTAAPPSADLSLSKSVSGSAAQVGTNVVYTLTVRNSGPSATSGVTIVDTLPAEVAFVSSNADRGSYDNSTGIWTVGNLASGEAVSARIVAQVAQSGTITNVAGVETSAVADPDSTPGNDSGTEDDEAAAVFVGTDVPVTADLQIVKSASVSTIRQGGTVNFAIVVTNRGPANATNVEVLEELPAGLGLISAVPSTGTYDPENGLWSISRINNGAAATLTVSARALTVGRVVNVAEIVASDQVDPTPTSAAQAAVTITAPPPVPTKLKITKTAPKTVKAGGKVTFTIKVTNVGTVPATNVILRDCVPSGLSLVRRPGNGVTLKNGKLQFPLGTLQPGQSRTFKITYTVDRNVRGFRGCTATVAGVNASPVSAAAQTRVIAGRQVGETPVAG